MGKLYLYGVFHANLQFSGIPVDQYPVILEQCYWPLLELCDRLPVKLGFEFPAYTLETIANLDAEFIETLRRLAETGKCELIGSGYSQNIYPLIPVEVNRYNLKIGSKIYQRLTGVTPEVAYVNEQVFAKGLTDVYADAGYKCVFIDWDNTTVAFPLPAEYRYHPQWIESGNKKKLQVLWNSFISFQRFQRYIHGDLDLNEYIKYLNSHWQEGEIRSFPYYGSDWELFDYRPANPDYSYNAVAGEEVARFRTMLEALLEDGRFTFSTPSEILEKSPTGNLIEISSAEYPLPCKKQAKYNVTRWALCGRDNTRKNTQCHKLLKGLQHLESLGQSAPSSRPTENQEGWRDLCYLWGSDFRTFTTEEKNDQFYNLIGYNLEKVKRLLGELCVNEAGAVFTLFNPSPLRWNGIHYCLQLRFQPGQIFPPFKIKLDSREVIQQVENVYYYRDGSVRSAQVVLYPDIAPLSSVKGQVCSGSPVTRGGRIFFDGEVLETPVLRAEFLAKKGLALRSLVFRDISSKPLARTLSHEFYDEVGLSTDQFTGHVIINDRYFNKITDLNKVQLVLPENLDKCHVRVPVRARIPLPIGELWKTMMVYVNEPRIDINYHFRLRDVFSESFRLGILTLNPEAFDQSSLGYAVVNGGNEPEHFLLGGRGDIGQDTSVDTRFSTTHCLGATEGWISVGDRNLGVAVITDKSQLYSVPLLNYKKTKNSFYLRLYNSIGEKDETSNHFWRGHLKFNVCYYGHKNDIKRIREISCLVNRGLILIGE